MRIDYKSFDRCPVIAEAREDLIISCLADRPKQIREIVNETTLSYHQIQTCLLTLRIKKGLVTKKKVGKITWHGLIPKLRKVKIL